MLIDIKHAGLPGGIRVCDDGAVRIGALATLSDLARSALSTGPYALLVQAAHDAATTQIRNRATVAGNLLQRPRCSYFRDPNPPCWLADGDVCFARDGVNDRHAIFDQGPCVAVHPSDLAPCLLASDASVEVVGPAGESTIPLASLFSPPDEMRRTEHTLGERSLITAIRLPAPRPGTSSAYRKAMPRRAWSFALASVAAVVATEGGSVASAAIVLGGVSNVPRRLPQVEALLEGAEPSKDLIAKAAQAAVDGATPLAHNAYKLELVRRLVLRTLEGVCRV